MYFMVKHSCEVRLANTPSRGLPTSGLDDLRTSRVRFLCT